MGFLKVRAILMIFVVVLSLFSVYLIGEAQPVSAVQPKACCERTMGGSFCVYTDAAQCDPSYHQTSTTCEQTSYCQPVCCLFPQQGNCYARVGAAHCANQAGAVVVAGDPSCTNTPGCEKGCCQLGNQCFWTTQQRCVRQAASYPGLDLQTVWNGNTGSEAFCLDQCAQQEEGCCVDLQVGCQWMTQEQCPVADQGVGDGSSGFYGGIYCSASSLTCGCQERFRKGCVQGQEDVYWFDSCGNPEGIAEDCDYQDGTLCQEKEGSARCASVHCEQTVAVPNNPHDPRLGGFRSNGEGWCSYESGTGGFYDRPGSRHYRHVCVNGRELVEECKDYREEICVSGQSTSGQLSYAQCKRLDEFSKIDLDLYQRTSSVEQSIVMPNTPGFSDSSKKLISSTTVDKGSRFWEGQNALSCQKGTTQCKVIWAKKGYWDDWDCEGNCHCETQEYLAEAANYCKMFGDCGADVNILGQGTQDGISVTWTGASVGSRPTHLTSNIYDRWNVYGIFGGMLALKDIFDTSLTNHVASFLGGAAVANALAYVAYYAYLGSTVGFGSLSVNILGLAATGPWGLAALVVIAILAIIFKDQIGEILGDLLGYETKTKTVTITCEPWSAPVGGDDCEKCDDDVRYDTNSYSAPVVCSEYRCKSLGTACEVINVGTSNEQCVSRQPNDVSPPVIRPWVEILPAGYAVALTGAGYAVQPDVGYWQKFTFGIETDEVSQCKWDDVHTNSYDEMAHFFGTSLFGKQFNLTVSLPGGHDYTYYARCVDVNGNANVQEYTIQFATTDEPDLTPPVIEGTSLVNGAYLFANMTSTPLWLYLNEPVSTCWWNKGMDGDSPLSVSHTFVCGDSDSCVGLLQNVTQGAGQQSLYYFRCTDLANNTMQQGYQFTLKGSLPLKILSGAPSGTLYTHDVTLRVVTSEGAEQGKARCRFAHQPQGIFVDFFSTGGNKHSQSLMNLARGDYPYRILCEDVAGNRADTLLSFRIDVDMDAPQILQVYTVGNIVTLVLNEPSTCRYRVDTPHFSFEEGTLAGTDSVIHVLTEVSPVYYVTCQDQFGNMLEGVTIYA